MRLLILLALLALAAPVQSQGVSAPCGVVDAIDMPIDRVVEGYDDFGRYRARFGGNHVGLDIGFDRWGDPVRAAARGRVTYADIEGWDTEKGVVIVEHTFPDGSIAYSLYGHVEQTDTILLPSVGRCVERGDVIGAIGWPSRGRPHLHYEIRRFLADDGGPGYVSDNPLDDGWYHPLDFTALWRTRLNPAYLSSVTFNRIPSLPPVALDSGGYAAASGNTLTGVTESGEIVWRVETDGAVIGLAALPGDRLAAHTETGQAMTLQNGRYLGLWSARGADTALRTLGETLVFPMQDGGLTAYDPAGKALWALPGVTGGRFVYFEAGNGHITAGVDRGEETIWRQVDSVGQVQAELTLPEIRAAAPLPDGGWMALAGNQLKRLDGRNNHDLAAINLPPGQNAALAVDAMGTSYVYSGGGSPALLAIGAEGQIRWQVDYPVAGQTPLLAAGGGCLLYTLDVDGMLNVWNAGDGSLVNQLQLYAGGRETHSPGGRLLRVDAADRVQVSAGFLTMLTLDGLKLGGEAASACRLG